MLLFDISQANLLMTDPMQNARLQNLGKMMELKLMQSVHGLQIPIYLKSLIISKNWRKIPCSVY